MQAGIKTASGNDKWQWTTMKNVLLGWRAAGVRTYRRKPLSDGAGGYVKGIWEPIISLEDREAALAMLKKRGLTKVRQGKWLLKGLVTCGECGGKMYGQLTGAKTYSCKDGSGHVAISAERLEQWVEGHLVAHITDRMEKEREGGQLQQSEEPAEWPHEAKLRRVDEKMTELMSAYNNDELSGEVVFPQIKKFEAERGELRRERDDFYALQAQPTTDYNSFEEIVDWGLDNVAIKDGDDEATIDKKRSFFREGD
ncbi:hypothetical protein GWK18_09930 [Kocuria sp. JC486]|uniref:recombinase zinc beta ribbon domain-containing protein n=1 Tax=Kocuria sp. JC486 TaxID=1970736 RepID=UPI0014235993|nr:recombinase zinc beta ribbon domain-containing protein [Kocuria sp. JC486]NHU85897.1 hypothetical protein [Kocuria sp. JC486]